MESKSHCLGLFHPAEFLLLLLLLTFSPSPNALWVYVARYQRACVKPSGAEQKPCDVLLVATLSFDYSTIISYLSSLEELNNLIITQHCGCAGGRGGRRGGGGV